jgi:hypothetical protein
MSKSVGYQIGDKVWFKVRVQINTLSDQVRNQVANHVRDQVTNQVWDQVRNPVWDQIWDQIK